MTNTEATNRIVESLISEFLKAAAGRVGHSFNRAVALNAADQ